MTRTDRTISSVGGGAPDWDSSKVTHIVNTSDSTVQSTTPYTIPDNGWLLVSIGGASIWTVSVNGIYVLGTHNRTNQEVPDLHEVIPVSKDDVLEWTTASIYDGSAAIINFYPFKA